MASMVTSPGGKEDKTDGLNNVLPIRTGEKTYERFKPALNTVQLPHQVEEQSKPKLPARGVFTIIGGFILCLSFGSDFSFSNINTYLTSYMRVNGYSDDLSSAHHKESHSGGYYAICWWVS